MAFALASSSISAFGWPAAHNFALPVHNHLGSVDAVCAENVRVLVLPFRKFGCGIGIPPAEMIPVIDVFFERDDLNVIHFILLA
jgi:hypothetical protein